MLHDPTRQQIVFPARLDLRKFYLLYTFFFGLLTIATLSIPFLDRARSTLMLMPVGLLLFGGFLVLMLRSLAGIRKCWGADERGLFESKSGRCIPWEQIADIDLGHGLGGIGELDIILLDAQRRKLASISAHSMADLGFGLLDLLQARLPHIFERNTLQYLSGECTWSIPGIRQVMQLDRDLLHIEFPKLKRQIIPLHTIQRVEWLPGAISGNKLGFVRITHAAGQIELPQRIRGMQYFLYALKHFAGLGDLVNPAASPALALHLAQTRRKATRSSLWRITGIILIVIPLFHLVKTMPVFTSQRNARRLGDSVTATITQRLPNHRLELSYHVHGKPYITRVALRRDHVAEYGDCTTLTVRVLALQPKVVWFPGIGVSDLRFIGFLAIIAVMIGAGITILILVQRRAHRFAREIAQLETAAFPPPAESAPQPPAWEPPPPTGFAHPVAEPPSALETSISPPSAYPASQPADPYAPPSRYPPLYPLPPARTCTQCGQPIYGPYYLDGTDPWCPPCKTQQPTRRPKLSFWGMVRAFCFGAVGALVAASLWATTSILTGYELGIIAILVGLIVGYAVRVGARGPGSRSAQVIALGLTLYALSYAMIPIVIHQIMRNPEMRAAVVEGFERGLQMTGEHDRSLDEQATQDIITSLTLSRCADSAPAIAASDAATSLTSTAGLADLASIITPEDEQIYESITSGTTITTRIATLFADDLADLDFNVVPTATSDTLLVLDAHPSTSATLLSSTPCYPLSGFSLPEPDPDSFAARHPLFGLAIGLLLLAILFLLAPVIINIMTIGASPMSALFLAIALWEAWKLNRHVPRDFAGPFADQPEISFAQAEYHP